MEIIITKKATKTKLEQKYFYNSFTELGSIPSHYVIEYNCACGNKIKNTVWNWRKKKHNTLCQSCAIKEEWKTEEYKTYHSECIKLALSTPQAKKKRSRVAKRNWRDKKYRTKTLAALKIAHAKPEYTLKLRAGQKRCWEKEEYRTLFYKRINSEEYKEKQRLGIKKKWENKRWVKKQLNRENRKFSQITYKGIFCRSFAEYTFIKLIEGNYKKIESCDFVVPYFDKKGKSRNYNPDFKLTTFDNKIVIIEVKGTFLKDLKDLDLDTKNGHRFCSLDRITLNLKFEALKNYCKEEKFTYELITFDNKDFRKLYTELKKQEKNENIKNRTS